MGIESTCDYHSHIHLFPPGNLVTDHLVGGSYQYGSARTALVDDTVTAPGTVDYRGRVVALYNPWPGRITLAISGATTLV